MYGQSYPQSSRSKLRYEQRVLHCKNQAAGSRASRAGIIGVGMSARRTSRGICPRRLWTARVTLAPPPTADRGLIRTGGVLGEEASVQGKRTKTDLGGAGERFGRRAGAGGPRLTGGFGCARKAMLLRKAKYHKEGHGDQPMNPTPRRVGEGGRTPSCLPASPAAPRRLVRPWHRRVGGHGRVGDEGRPSRRRRHAALAAVGRAPSLVGEGIAGMDDGTPPWPL